MAFYFKGNHRPLFSFKEYTVSSFWQVQNIFFPERSTQVKMSFILYSCYYYVEAKYAHLYLGNFPSFFRQYEDPIKMKKNSLWTGCIVSLLVYVPQGCIFKPEKYLSRCVVIIRQLLHILWLTMNQSRNDFFSQWLAIRIFSKTICKYYGDLCPSFLKVYVMTICSCI